MSEVQTSLSSSVVAVLFDLEAAIYQSHLYPLKSHLTIQSLLADLRERCDAHETLQISLRAIMDALDRVIESGGFLSTSQLSDLLAWVSRFRSVWVAQQSFDGQVDDTALQTFQSRLVNTSSALEHIDVQRFIGEFYGRIPHGFEDFSALSDIGYWVIDHAENTLSGIQPKTDSIAMRVVIETGLTLSQLTVCLPNWHWQSVPLEGSATLSLSPESENYWIDWLHTMAAEREVWRRSASFLRFYKSLQEQVREQFSAALGQLYNLPLAAGVWVRPAQEKVQGITEFDLYGGRVYLLDNSGQAQQVLALSESVMPVYVLEFVTQCLVIPVYRAQLVSDVTNAAPVWSFDQGEWCIQETLPSDQQLLRVSTPHASFYLSCTRVTRDYGVVLRTGCLPRQTQNIWRVREVFLQEPVLPQSNQQALQRQWFVPSMSLPRPKNHTPVYFQLTEDHGIELFADMVVGLVPYRSLEWVMPGFIYHSGQVIPLIEPEVCHCHTDDMVILVEVRGRHFAFRGRYSLAKEALHPLVDGDVIMLSWQSNRINISLRDKGWFLLDQRHSYLFHKQLLEILK